MSDSKYYVPSLSDDKIFDSFVTAFKSLESTGKAQSLQINFVSPIAYSAISFQSSASITDDKEKLFKNKSNKIISTVTISFSNFSLVYYRTPQNIPVNGSYGEVRINTSGQPALTPEILQPIISTFLKDMYIGKVDKSLDTDQNLISAHSEILSKLESLGLDLQKETKSFRDRLEEEFLSKRKKLEDEADKRSNDLESYYNTKHEELDALKKRLDDKNNTHARREIRKDLTAAIKNRIENFRLSNDTSDLRTPIHVAFSILILSSGVGAFLASREFLQLIGDPKFLENSIAVILGILKPLGLTALFSTSFIFYIKWLNAWFNKSAEEEMTLRRFQLDVDRSSWIVETVLESVSQHSHQLPPELILRFSNGLFSKDNEFKNDLEHPIDQLASALLGSAAKAKLKFGENELELDKQSLKKLKE
ncbi:MAG: hypothetical protein ACLGHN_03570 [Bacteriovoracia bacterium]